jgi:hypothetical protein
MDGSRKKHKILVGAALCAICWWVCLAETMSCLVTQKKHSLHVTVMWGQRYQRRRVVDT